MIHDKLKTIPPYMCMLVFILYTHPTNKDFSDHPIITLASQGLCVQRGFTIGACVFQTPAFDYANAAQSLTRESCRPLIFLCVFIRAI